MENASKALVMAGGVLISLMIIASLVIIYNQISNYSSSEIDEQRKQEIVVFNQGYTTYNKQRVKGSELLSLINKALDYNEREANPLDKQYQKMEIYINLNANGGDKTSFAYETSGQNRNKLFTSNKYAHERTGESSDIGEVTKKASNLENKYKSLKVIATLSANISTITYPETLPSGTSKDIAIQRRKEILDGALKGTGISYSSSNEISQIIEDTKAYYEYSQFKRAYFKCTGEEYNQDTGRIVKMSFEFLNKFQ